MTTLPANSKETLTAVTGVQLAQGIGVQEAKGFWADAWGHVIKRAGARFAMAWLGILGVVSILAPLIASGHPWVYRELGTGGEVTRVWSPLITNLTPGDVLLLLGTVAGAIWMRPHARFRARSGWPRSVLCAVVGGATLVASALAFSLLRGSEDAATRRLASQLWAVRVPVALGFAALFSVGAFFVLPMVSAKLRAGVLVVMAILSTIAAAGWAIQPLQTFPYRDAIAAGKAEATFTLVPFSPGQRDVRGDFCRP